MTKNPFGVNLTLLPALVPPDYSAYAQVIIDEGIKIVETAGNSPGPVIKQLKAVGTTILHKCTTIRHAQSAVKLGVDFLSIDGFECAGHVGEHDITNFILLSRARQSLGVPFIASGGFADGQGLAAALALGACGTNMGTRFMCTVEAPIHQNIKQAIVDAQETDTELVLRRWKNTSRLFANKVTKAAVKIEKESTTGKFEEVAEYVSGKRGRQVFLNGDKDFGVSSLAQLLSMVVPNSIRCGPRVRSLGSSTISQPARSSSHESSARQSKQPSRHRTSTLQRAISQSLRQVPWVRTQIILVPKCGVSVRASYRTQLYNIFSSVFDFKKCQVLYRKYCSLAPIVIVSSTYTGELCQLRLFLLKNAHELV